MLNEVAIEGHVIGTSWRWSGDTMFRVGVDRDLQRGRKGTGARDGSDYFTVRAPAQTLAGMPVDFREGMRVRVHGFLQSREYQETLKTYLTRANGLTRLVSVTDEIAEQITLNRVATEILAERIAFVPERQKAATSASTASQESRPRRSRNGQNKEANAPAEAVGDTIVEAPVAA